MNKFVFIILMLFASNSWGISLGQRPFIESIQHITATVPSGDTSKVLTAGTDFTAVDRTRTAILLNGVAVGSASEAELPRLSFTSDTEITIVCAGGGSSAVDFTIIEFSKGIIKSKHSGTITIPASATDNSASITPNINSSNSLVFYKGVNATTDITNQASLLTRLSISDSTITAQRSDTDGEVNVNYTVIEFYNWVSP